MVFEQSHPIQAASLQPLKKRQKELSLRKTTPLMRSKPHFIEKAPNQAASTTAQNLTISVPDGVKYVKGPLLKIWERFILLTESKRQIFGVRTFDAHASAYSTMSLLKVIKFCEHFGFLDQNLVTPGEVATLFAQCTKIHSSFDRLMKQFHCDEFLAQKRMVNCEIQIQDFLNFMVRLAVLIFSRPPFEQDNELTVAEKVKAFISHFRFDDCAHIRKVLDEAKGEDHMNRRKGTSLKKQNGIMNSVRSNFGGLNESENRYMDSLEISDMELLPLMEILVLEKPRYRELERFQTCSLWIPSIAAFCIIILRSIETLFVVGFTRFLVRSLSSVVMVVKLLKMQRTLFIIDHGCVSLSPSLFRLFVSVPDRV